MLGALLALIGLATVIFVRALNSRRAESDAAGPLRIACAHDIFGFEEAPKRM
jgi:hypothetical protein